MDYIKNYSLEGKVAWITGASYGIGFAIAKAMAGAGAVIVFNDIRQELVDKGVEAYKAEGITAHGYVCDVTDEDAVNQVVETIEKEVGTVDILVNNAGIIKRIPMIEMAAKDFRQVIDVDLNPPFIVTKDLIPDMIKKADLVITHAGVGSILTALRYNKKVIATARLKMYGEHVNDHQIQILENFSENGYILKLDDVDKLGEMINNSKGFQPKKYMSNTDNFVKNVKNEIQVLLKNV